MYNRRSFIRSLGFLTGGALLGCRTETIDTTRSRDIWFMPNESDPHERTWMAFGASSDIWGRDLLSEVQKNLATIALTIAKYEPVSMLVRDSDLPLAQRLMGDKVELIVCPLDDLWMRDAGPVFVVTENGDKAAVDFNFNGWGKKQDFDRDAKVAAFVAKRAGMRPVQTDLMQLLGLVAIFEHHAPKVKEEYWWKIDDPDLLSHFDPDIR